MASPTESVDRAARAIDLLWGHGEPGCLPVMADIREAWPALADALDELGWALHEGTDHTVAEPRETRSGRADPALAGAVEWLEAYLDYPQCPPPGAVHYGVPLWHLGLDGDDGLMVAGHDRRAYAALNAEIRADERDRVDYLRRLCEASYTGTDPALIDRNPHPARGYDITARWVLFDTRCGCTEAEHEAHLAEHDGYDEDCGCAFDGLPPCTDPGQEGALAWRYEDVNDGDDRAQPVLLARWLASPQGGEPTRD